MKKLLLALAIALMASTSVLPILSSPAVAESSPNGDGR